jgi:hypothetical protein
LVKALDKAVGARGLVRRHTLDYAPNFIFRETLINGHHMSPWTHNLIQIEAMAASFVIFLFLLNFSVSATVKADFLSVTGGETQILPLSRFPFTKIFQLIFHGASISVFLPAASAQIC